MFLKPGAGQIALRKREPIFRGARCIRPFGLLLHPCSRRRDVRVRVRGEPLSSLRPATWVPAKVWSRSQELARRMKDKIGNGVGLGKCDRFSFIGGLSFIKWISTNRGDAAVAALPPPQWTWPD